MIEETSSSSASRSHLKRLFPDDAAHDSDDDNSHRAPVQKKVRFPKGKKGARKVKLDESHDNDDVGDPIGRADPRSAAKERAKQRNEITAELFCNQDGANLSNISMAEENYEDNSTFEDDGIVFEPFNLTQEREEGYFDAEGNFVEYVRENEIKDAWLDNVHVDLRFAEKQNVKTSKEEDVDDLSSEDIGNIKRRIANLLLPGETVLHALRRLKGNSNDKKGKMPEETMRLFDQLTEDSMKLMEKGEYNVYYEEQEVFEREADGYEHIARAREVTTMNGKDMFSGEAENGVGSFSSSDLTADHSILNLPTAQVSFTKDDGAYDIFGEDNENTANLPTNRGSSSLRPASENLASSQNIESGETAATELGTDYVYDEMSGYYYSCSLGYYYDPTSGLYCCATSGKWYSYNDQTGTYNEVTGEDVVDSMEDKSS